MDVSQWTLGGGCLVVYAPLCFVRRIEVFASTHVFADAMIAITIITIIVYSIKKDVSDGNHFDDLVALNTETWPDTIGFAVYAYEGIGVILPVMDITANED